MNKTLNYAGALELSLNDYTGHPSTVIFFRNCNFNCFYCHNRDIITGCHVFPIPDVEKVIDRTKNFISAVVFSGGEPTLQAKPLIHLANYTKKCGLKVGLNTNGSMPSVILEMLSLDLLDKVFIDVKTSLTDTGKYRELIATNVPNITTKINKSLCLLADSNIDTEVRTTVFESIHTPEYVIKIMEYLDTINKYYNENGDFSFKVQIGRRRNGEDCDKEFDIESLEKLIEKEDFSFTEILV